MAAARVLAPESFGLLALAMTTGWILGVASDAGLPLYLARAVAHDDTGAAGVLADVMRLRARLAGTALGIGALVAAVYAPAGYRLAFGLIVGAQLAGSVLDTLSHVYRGLGRSEIESTITIGHRLGAALLAVVVLIVEPTLLLLATALIVPPLVALAVSWAVARRLAGTNGPGTVAGLGMARFTRDALPIGAAVLVSALYFRCDVYFINYWHGLDTVGMYNAVFRLVEALRLFPAAVLAVVFPELCRATNLNPVRRLSVVLLSVGGLAMACTIVAAPGTVYVIYGEPYRNAAAPLQVLGLALPLFFLNYALTHQVIGWNGQRGYLAITIAALVANIGGNLLLIPSGGMLGAAWSTVLTELVVTAGCVIVLKSRSPRR